MGEAPTKNVIVSPAAIKRLHNGHRWIFANEFITPVGELPTGEVVHIVSPRNEHIAYAHTNPHSLITGRILTSSKTIPDTAWLIGQLEGALRYRAKIGYGNVCRLVYAEADSLPGLTIDRYDRHFAVQIVSAGMERWKSEIVDWLQKRFQASSIVLRNDTPFRSQEGLPIANEIGLGKPPERFSWSDRGSLYLADLQAGQKTGAFLDQRTNRYEMDWISEDCSILDLFCHHGGFGLRAAVTGAKRVVFVDSSQSALAITEEAAAANSVQERCEFRREDIFEWLQNQSEKFDIVVCDPPSLIKNRAALASGERGYKKLNRLAMNAVSPGGVLLTFSCSHLMGRLPFREMLRDASKGEPWILTKEFMQAEDHPVLIGHPETEYLKGALLRNGIE